MSSPRRILSSGDDFSRLIEPYLESRELQVGAEVLKSERRYLELFRRVCEVSNIHHITESHIVLFHQHLLSRPGRQRQRPSDSLVCKALRTTRRFLVWAVRFGHLLRAPNFQIPRRAEELPRVPSLGEVRRLFLTPDTGTAVGLRDQLCLELLYGLGLRLCECHRLDLDHFDLRGQSVVINGKGGHQRRLPLGSKLLACYREYLDRARPRFRPPSEETAVLVGRCGGRRLGHQAIYLRVKVLGQRAGLSLRPHQLRHACATHMLAAGAQLRHLQEFLGHVRITATQRYTRVCPQDLHQEFRRCHPRARH